MNTICAKVLMAVSAVVFVVTAVNSVGYFYPDEHYQLIEFARWKMGVDAPGAVPWELPAAIRPTLQPVATMLVFELLGAVGVDSPFALALTLRLLMAVMAFGSIYILVQLTLPDISSCHKNAYMALSFLLWFVPYISVRYSSETMSAVFLLPAVGLLCDVGRNRGVMTWRRAVLVGLLLGLSFEMRYQVMAAVVGLLLWYVIEWRGRWRGVVFVATGFLAVAVVSTLVDCWFYGRWVMAPLSYFRENIINGVAAGFGVSPWYDYVVMLLNRPTPFVGVCLLLSLLLAVVRRHRSPVVWVVVFFVASHSIVGHKELRFMFPMAYFMPLLLVWAWECVYSPRLKALFAVFVVAFVITDVAGLAMLAGKPARNGRVEVARLVYDDARIKRVVCTRANNPYRESYLSLNFYLRRGVMVCTEADAFLVEGRTLADGDVLILTEGDSWRRSMAEDAGLRLVRNAVPEWVQWLNRYFKTYAADGTLLVYVKKD